MVRTDLHAARRVSPVGGGDRALKKRNHHMRCAKAALIALAWPALAQPGPLNATWTTETGVGTLGGGVEFVGGEPAYEASLIVAPPTRTPIAAPNTVNPPRKLATVGRRTASLLADLNGIRLTTTAADGTGEASVVVRTPVATASSAFIKPPNIRDLLAGSPQEEENACYTVFGGDVLAGESEDDPVLFLIYCARRVYDDPRGVGPRTSEFNWAYDQIAVLSASVDTLTPGVMPDWTIQISDRVHQSQRVADNNAIGQTWAANVTENPASPGEYIIGMANYLNGNKDNALDMRGLNTIHAARAIVQEGAWSLSPWVEIDAYDPGASGRHTHFAIPYWLGDRVAIVYAIGDSASQDPSAPFVDQGVLGRATLLSAAETFDPGNPAFSPLTGGLATSTTWNDPDGTITSTATGFVRIGPRSLASLAPADTGLAGFSAAGFLHGSFFDEDLMPGLQPVGAVAAGGRVWMGADENLPAMVSFPQVDLLTDTPVIDAVQGLPDWDIAFSMTSARDGSAYAWISRQAIVTAPTQRLLWLAEGRWGTLTNPESRLTALGASPAGVLINSVGVERVAPPPAARVSRGLVAGPAVENVAIGTPIISTQNDPNLAMTVLSNDELAALGVPPPPVPGMVVVRVTAQSGVRRDSGVITWNAVPELGPSVVTFATFNIADRQAPAYQSRMFAWDGATNVNILSRLSIGGPANWSTRGWQIRNTRAPATTLASLGGVEVAPRLTFRWTNFQPALFSGDFVAAVAITPTDPDRPATMRIAGPGDALPAIGLDARFLGSCAGDWATLVALETGPGFATRVEPADARTPLVSFLSDLAGTGPAIELEADTTVTDHALIVRSIDAFGVPTEARVTTTPGNAPLEWDAYSTVRFVMTAEQGRQLWMSWDGRPFGVVWSDPGASWCPVAARVGLRDGAEVGDVRVHHAARQSGIVLADADEVLAWAQASEAAMIDRSCNPADIAEPFGAITFADVSAFLAAFATGNPDADLAPPLGQFTFADISAFLAAFAAGCP